jgi:hypothetical protein
MNTPTKIPHSEVLKVINDFDFDKVQKVMAFTGWKWTTHNPNDSQETEIPSVKRLIRSATRMLQDTADGGRGWSTGGFEVNRIKREDGTDYLRLSFTLESADSEYPTKLK